MMYNAKLLFEFNAYGDYLFFNVEFLMDCPFIYTKYPENN